MKQNWMLTLAALLLAINGVNVHGNDTPPLLKEGKAPQTFEAMWSGFDPRAEPLEVEVLKEWEEDGVVLKVLHRRVDVFKGQKAMMMGVSRKSFRAHGRNKDGFLTVEKYKAGMKNVPTTPAEFDARLNVSIKTTMATGRAKSSSDPL